MNVLITSASRKVALVRAFQRALAATGGGIVVAGDASASAAALYLADRGVILPRSDADDFVSEIIRLCSEQNIGLVVPTRDEELPVFASARERFEERGVAVAISSPSAIATCQDKGAFLAFCTANGFSTPDVLVPDDLAEGDFPVFLKPRVGKGGRGAQRIDSRVDLLRALSAVDDALVQVYCNLPELTLDVFVDRDSRVLSVLPRTRTLVVGGESYISTTVKNDRLIRRGEDLVVALGLYGHLTVQCFWSKDASDGEPSFIEVNPRFGGAANLGFAAGHPTPEYLVRSALGERVERRVGEFEDGLTMLRYAQDVFVTRDGVQRDLT